MPLKDLAYRFGESLLFILSTLDAAFPKIAEKMKFLIRWPQNEDVMRNRPQCFKDTFPKCMYH